MLKLTIEPTATITMVDGVPCRIWQGVTDRGTPIEAYVRAIKVPSSAPAAEQRRLETVLQELPQPRAGSIPLRFLT